MYYGTKAGVVCETVSNSKTFDFPSVARRPLGSTNVNVQSF